MDGEHCTPVGVVDTLHSQVFHYDSVGNRADDSPTIIAGNRLISWLGYTLSYDSVGNLVHKSKPGFDQYLYWNSLGQLDSVKTNGALVSFGYDGFGRRVRKTIGTAATLEYIYDGAQLATIDSAGTRIQTFTYYPGSETPHSMLRNAGNRQYYLSEIGAGSVWGLTDSAAAVKNHYRYAPFGLLEDSLEVVKNPLRFTGREYDPETRLYYNRARYYDPELARFISEDPIGQNGGSNQYAYVGNDPINATDPSGTECGYTTGKQSELDGGPCSGGRGATSLGYARDFVMSWGDWEALASPPHCSGMSADQCSQMHSAIGRLQEGTEGKQCQSLGDDAAYRLYTGTYSYRSESSKNAGEYWPAERVQAEYTGFQPAAWNAHGVIFLFSGAFSKGIDYLFFVVAHEEAHAVFGLHDLYEKVGNDYQEIVDARNPASAMAIACQEYYNNAHQ